MSLQDQDSIQYAKASIGGDSIETTNMDSNMDSQVSLEHSIDLSDASVVAKFTKEERLAEIARCRKVIK